MAAPIKKSRATGWIGSKFVGIPAATGQPVSTPGVPDGVHPVQLPADPAAPAGTYPYQGKHYGAAPLGFQGDKWGDTNWNTTKYVAGRTLAAGGTIDDVLANPLYQGWTKTGSDKITSPGGNTYDLYYDYGGPNQRVQYTTVAGPALDRNGIPGVNSAGVSSALKNDGIRGNYAAATAGGSTSVRGGAPAAAPYSYAPFQAPAAFNYEDYQAPAPFRGPEWKPPTDVSDANDPGYTARLREGEQALQRSAAAKGSLLTGGTLKDLSRYGQDYAANEYKDVYGRAYQDYTTDYQRQAGEYKQDTENAFRDYATSRANAFENYGTNYQNALNAYKTNFETSFQPWQANANEQYRSWLGNYTAGQQAWQNQFDTEGQRFGQLYNTAALGQQAVGQAAQYGQGYANNLSNLYGNYGNQQSDLITNQGNANAAAQAASGGAWGDAWGGVGQAAAAYGIYGGGMYGNNQPYGYGYGAGGYGDQGPQPWMRRP